MYSIFFSQNSIKFNYFEKCRPHHVSYIEYIDGLELKIDIIFKSSETQVAESKTL